MACSLDGFIAGEDDDLSWLPETQPEHTEGIDFNTFFDGVGVLLLGRRSYDVVMGFDVPWPYGEMPVLVATNRVLESPHPTVSTTSGEIREVISHARKVASGKNVYIDGGALIRQALDAGLVDEITLTVIPVILGAGISLFAGTDQRHKLELVDNADFGDGMVQLRYRINKQA
jgi:dihydrofolate reductase